ncbi:MAG: DUF2125 domain-containing protein [Rhodobacteraceae bacterium]|nr:DUF2125 domain-containing protein [Paracoccaceae bacterium]
MSVYSRSLLTSAALFISFGLPMQAQDLAQEVIDEYIDQMAASGGSVTPGNKSASGKTVEYTDLVVALPQNTGSYTLAFVRAEEIGGGKVQMSYPDKIAITIDPAGEQPAMDIALDLTGIEHIVSGSKGARNHDVKGAAVDIRISATEPALNMNIGVTDIISSTVASGSDPLHYAGDMKAASASIAYDITDDEMNMAGNFRYENLAATLDMDVVTEEDVEKLLSGERGLSVSYSVGRGEGKVDIKQPDMSGTLTFSADSGKAAISILDGMFSMLGTAKGADYEFVFAELPLPPFQASINSALTEVSMPLKKTDAVAPAKIHFNLDGLKASDTLWGMLDPTGSLPRDAANLNVDLSANMKWLVDLVKIDEAQDMPVEVQDVSINDVTLEIAGARLNGVGSATINNAMMPPMPVGEVNLDLKGGVGLLDKLVALGLVPQDQGQMIKAMSGMFTLPGGDGNDHLTSKIEMQEGGAILANGQRIK